MRGAVWALLLACAPGPLSAEGALTVYDRGGNIITISNRAQSGGGSSIDMSSANRLGAVNWRVSHQDRKTENAYAASVDASGSIYLAGARKWQGSNYFWLMKVSSRGDVLWETAVHGWPGCYAFFVAANAQGNVWASGACSQPNAFPMMTARFDPGGNTLWSQRFSAGVRNYVRSMTLDFLGYVSLIVETGQGNSAGANNQMRTVVYDPNGNQVALY